MKILIICNAGMSTGIMQVKLQEEAKRREMSTEVLAIPMVELEENLEDVDIVLLGPQVRFAEEDIRKTVPKAIPVLVISSIDFGTMNAKKVMDDILKNLARIS